MPTVPRTGGTREAEEYARAVFGVLRPPLDDGIVNERVAARPARQEIFHRRPHPLMSFVIDKLVLRRPTGGRDVLRGQLEQMLLVSHVRHVEVQVMPLTVTRTQGWPEYLQGRDRNGEPPELVQEQL